MRAWLIATLTALWGVPALGADPPRAVVLIVVDTQRADGLSCYGASAVHGAPRAACSTCEKGDRADQSEKNFEALRALGYLE